MDRLINPVYRALNRPLLVMGVERKLFFFILTLSLALFVFFEALVPALTLFCTLWLAARLAARTDPQILRILINSNRFAARYDPAKWESAEAAKGGRCG